MKKLFLFLLATTLIFSCKKQEEKQEKQEVSTRQFKTYPATVDLLAKHNLKGTLYEAFADYRMVRIKKGGLVKVVKTGKTFKTENDLFAIMFSDNKTYTLDRVLITGFKGNISYKFTMAEFPTKWKGSDAGFLSMKYYLPGARHFFKGKKYNKIHQIPIASGTELPKREYPAFEDNIIVDIWCNYYSSGKKYPKEKNYRSLMLTSENIFVFDGTGNPGMLKGNWVLPEKTLWRNRFSF